MDIMMGLINLFMAPFVGVALFYKKNDEEMKPDVKLISRYIVFIVCILAVDILIMNVIGLDVEVWSKPYTVIALLTSCLIPYVIQIAKSYFSIKLEVKPRTDNSGK